MIDYVFHAQPKFYGIVYLLLIPIFGCIYYFLPETIGQGKSIVECLYFSTVTITTLGYGDISPINDLGKLIASSESVLGIIVIGLFLNSLSRVHSEITKNEEIKKEKKRYLESEVSKLNAFYNLINPLIEKYMLSVVHITSPLKSRSENYNPNFTLSDMQDLYSPAALMTQYPGESAVKYFLSSQQVLYNEVSSLIKIVDLRLFPELEGYCHSFVKSVHDFRCSDFILDAPKNNNMKKAIIELLKNHEGEVKYVNANLINPYVALYYQIKEHMNTLNLINLEVSKTLKKKSCEK